MKTILKFALCFSLLFCIVEAQAQYKSAVGLRWEDNLVAASYKYLVKDNIMAEGFVGAPTYSGASGLVLGAHAALYFPIPDVENLNYYYGAGAGAYLGDVTALFVRGVGGADYSFEDVPINISAELLPTLSLGDNSDFDFNFSFGIRYILN